MIPALLGKMLDEMAFERTPFTLENSKRLKLLSLILVIYAVLEAVLAFIDSKFIVSLNDNSIEIGNLVHDFAANAGTTLDLFPLVIAAVFFALSYVFQYGVLLQQESDETL